MPRLLIVTTVAATLRAFLLPYAKYFKNLGWQVDALARDAASCEECLKTFDRCYDVPFSRSPWSIGLRGRGLREMNARIRSLVEEGQYDIVHVHTPVAAFVTRLALSKLREESRPKVVYTAHGFHFHSGGCPLKNGLFIALERLAGKWTDCTITINREDYDAALARKIAKKENLFLLPGIGLDFSAYSPETVSFDIDRVRRTHLELGLTTEDEMFLMVAEFNRGKRHRDALSALKKTGRKDFHLVFAGSGPLEEDMKRLAFSLGIASQVHFLGQRTDVPLLMLSSRATLLPSEREGLNRSVMESICLGIPVLGADVRGIRDLITSPDRGTLFPVGNTAALAAAMILSVENPCPVKPKPDPAWNIDSLLREHEKIYETLMTFKH
ncbi:MAG: glycosyltransferase family 4 protein [Synergistaceae bacterium]|jgi:glycosyltransferase involved in cell wall biosynthesis|nr:glycosyltransferase family 4 protein [Synergistaceae bacterium]